ncbi:hypothetical protein L915_12890 [Phytophthora nicotianae]|uniref:Uncharacterized protein n=1 Tax=Phytophthora nicotianae TaxID=4792 RepID=W2GF55_PHYNI|nr:hypothetical protein L915_12890 [Phytophthora nicotianae]ETL35030.1 hypothetical protein L916_12798 [Phytophthora nicotianae]
MEHFLKIYSNCATTYMRLYGKSPQHRGYKQFILGKDVLTTLGIDVGCQLEQFKESDITGGKDSDDSKNDLEFDVECDNKENCS